MNIIDILKSDNRVVQKSLNSKIKVIDQLRSKSLKEDAEDIEAELRAAIKLLRISIIKLEFSESPDIKISTKQNEIWGIEVKRIRLKNEDIRDENKFLENQKIDIRDRTLVRYGYRNKHPWTLIIKDAILDKIGKLKNHDTIFIIYPI